MLKIDFTQPSFLSRLKQASATKELLAKAVAVKKYKYILDATAGLGKDAFILASLGCTLEIIEKEAIIANLLTDALNRARASLNPYISSAAKRITLYHCNALDFLSQLDSNNLPEVIYLDPMFPPNNKSALVKKDMQLLAKLVAQTENSDLLLEPALIKAKYRVVVKRHKLSPFLANKNPDLILRGKTNRFDIYLCPR